MPEHPLTYASAGVDVEEAERALRGVAAAVNATHDERVLGGIGAFAAMVVADFPGYDRPVLVASVDGVGTKTKVAAMADDYSNIGRDIVNHCVNDILCQGAAPLFFLDYFGCSRLSAPVFDEVVRSAAEACAEVGCSLVGGETAEMPGVYLDGEIDVVGTIVGVVERERRLPRGRPTAGDRLVGIASEGLHTNGYSLARRALFEIGGLSVRDGLPGTEATLAEALLRPHRCYFKALYPLLQDTPSISAVAHVTGGGIGGNLCRVLPANVQAVVNRETWEPPQIFRTIQAVGQIPDAEMFRTFNMGIGMVLVVAPEEVGRVVARLAEAGEHAAEIGEVRPGAQDVQIV